MSTSFLTAEIAELRQVVRDLVVMTRDALTVDPMQAEARARLERACERAARKVGL